MLIRHLKKTESLSEKTFFQIKKSILPLGVFLLATSLILNRFFSENGLIAFISGLLLGLSIVASIVGIVKSKSFQCK